MELDDIPVPPELIRAFQPDPYEHRLPNGLRVITPAVEIWNRMTIIHYVWPVVPNIGATSGSIDWHLDVVDEHGVPYLPGAGGEGGATTGMIRGSVGLNESVHPGTQWIVLPFTAGSVSVNVHR